ncbi:MAG TPA: HD domain-containing phosphohydrolase [Solirubrobacterales bacterium]|nr:HD domain-containing phosphohydrolase [Solirubrobacterales bacterium]
MRPRTFFGRWVYDAVVLGASLAVIARSFALPDERGAWRALGLALLFWALGQAYYSVFLYYASPAPFPSPADAGFLAFYPASFLGIVLLLRARVAHLDPLAWVDGVIGALAIAAVAAALIFPPVLEALGGSALGVAVSLAYPCADLVLLGLVVAALALSGWRGQRTWLLIAAALLLFAVSDVVYLTVGGQSTTALNLASIGWPLAFLLLAAAAWLPARQAVSAASRPGRRRIAIPIALAALVVGLLALGNFTPIGTVAVALGIACLLAVLGRLAITFAQNAEMLEASRRDAVTDPLTSLANRRQLTADLERMLANPTAGGGLLALFDLDGFKAYNDGFGHPAGDDLLRRLGARLAAAVAPAGRAYRLGGDEFCVLAPAGSDAAEGVCLAAQRALSERGRGFEITASWGEVTLPLEAGTATAALRLADRRMYAQKGMRADSARSQTRGVLLRVLHEREPELDRHLEGVARLAAIAGRALDLEAEDLDVLVRAAELHDIGKVAIPDEVLQKRGPLSEVEWALMRKHTLIGERVLSAAPAMSQVAKLVRSTHERWDGSGYPDGLSGEAIPLGSRLILICDAYNAMTEKRAYREAMDDRRARAGLRQGAGTQFDPRLVEVFLASLAPAGVAD